MLHETKQQIIELFESLRLRSEFKTTAILNKVQTRYDISRDSFQNRFIRPGRLPNIEDELTLALVSVFTQEVVASKRCTINEALRLVELTGMPVENWVKLRQFFPTDEFDVAYKQYLNQLLDVTDNPRTAAAIVSSGQISSFPQTYLPSQHSTPIRTAYINATIVGRQSEVNLFGELITGRAQYRMLNIYGPGGIGKTVVGQKMAEHAARLSVPTAMIDGIQPDLTPDQILALLADGLVTSSKNEVVEDHLRGFTQQHQDYSTIHHILLRLDGLNAIYDVIGNVKDSSRLVMMAEHFGENFTSFVNDTMTNRFTLERYLRSAERELTASFINSVSDCLDSLNRPIALLLDTYEEMESVDDWVCRSLVPYLPDGAHLVILGRNQLNKVNFEWNEVGDAVYSMPLPELEEKDAKAYLRHFGLTDGIALNSIYQFTGGYPLLLVLVRHLAKEAGGWEQVGTLEASADRDRIANQLLERILREECVSDVQSFLEKGVVARWFDPEIIRIILEVPTEEARDIYDKLHRHSFVERHPYGLKFHDKIRELLLARLKFTSKSEYDRLRARLMEYYADEAGIGPEMLVSD